MHLFLLHPSPALWAAIAERSPAPEGGSPLPEGRSPVPEGRSPVLEGGSPMPERGAGPLRRADDPTAAQPASPLLASWGRDAREMQLVLASHEEQADAVHPAPPAAGGLLGRLQDDVREDRAAPGVPQAGELDSRLILDPGDRSVQVHACHGRARQVEVVRDAILHALAEDESSSRAT